MYTEDSKEIYVVDLGMQKNVFYDPRFIKDINEHFLKNSNDLLTIFDPIYGYDIEDFKHLNSIPVKNVNFASVEEEDVHKIVNQLTKVSHLGLEDCGALDFSSFTNLKSLGYTWYKNTIGLDKMTTLERLSISKLNTKNKNLEYLRKLTELKELNIFQSTLTSLIGIEDLKLKKLMLAHLPKLENLNSFKGNMNVETLDITNCKGLDVNLLPKCFPNVKNLTIENQGEIATIEPLLKELAKLEKISVAGKTKIEDIKSNSFYTEYLEGKKYYIKDLGVSSDWKN
ncbi:hypothetical protein ACQY1Q_02135 [Tenacibaculum sp. TC6]|uniref:hypothetical protein n=1 Tax=Tenacibaculum sp. TC6 TaxID=3423223 RepID=UPI003D36DFF7